MRSVRTPGRSGSQERGHRPLRCQRTGTGGMPRSSEPRLSFYPTGESTGSGITIEQISGMPTGLTGYPPPADLERFRFKNLQPPRPLLSETVTSDYLRPYKADITLRRYQIKAVDEKSPPISGCVWLRICGHSAVFFTLLDCQVVDILDRPDGQMKFRVFQHPARVGIGCHPNYTTSSC